MDILGAEQGKGDRKVATDLYLLISHDKPETPKKVMMILLSYSTKKMDVIYQLGRKIQLEDSDSLIDLVASFKFAAIFSRSTTESTIQRLWDSAFRDTPYTKKEYDTVSLTQTALAERMLNDIYDLWEEDDLPYWTTQR